MRDNNYLNIMEFWTRKKIPYVFDETLSLYQLVRLTVKYLNEVIKDQNELKDAIKEFIEMFDKDLEKTVIEVLEKWKDDGSLKEIINEALFESKLDKDEFEVYRKKVDNDLKYIKDNTVNKDYFNENSLVKRPQGSLPDSEINKSNIAVIKKSDGEFIIIQKINKEYVVHTFKSDIVDTGSSSVGGNGDLIRIIKSQMSSNVITWLDYESGRGHTIITESGNERDIESELFTLYNKDILNISNNGYNGLSLTRLAASETPSQVTFKVYNESKEKQNILFKADSSFNENIEIILNGNVIDSFKPSLFKTSINNYAIYEFNLPISKSEYSVTIRNTSKTKDFDIVAMNVFNLDDYKGQTVSGIKAFMKNEWFIDSGGSSDYAFLDENNKWHGSYHGGETSQWSRITWVNTYDTKFGSDHRFVFIDPRNPKIKNNDFIICKNFEMYQHTVVSNKVNIVTRTAFINGKIKNEYSIFNNSLKTKSFITTMTAAHKDMDFVIYPEFEKLTDNSEKELFVSEGNVTLLNSGAGLHLSTYFTKFPDDKNEKKGVYLHINKQRYVKLYHAYQMDSNPLLIKNLTFSKVMEFRKQ